jgi:hypothetical protein
MAVGNSGLILQSVSGYNWTLGSSGTVENLDSVVYNSSQNIWAAVGDNNTIINSTNNGVSWTDNSTIITEPLVYTVQGAEFPYGYGPEELVPGNVTDNLLMTVTTRPGTNWPAVEYQNVGYKIGSIELTTEFPNQKDFSFSELVNKINNPINNPMQLRVSVLYANNNGLGTTLTPDEDYYVYWNDNLILLNFFVELNTFPLPDKILIEVYEVGNGNQLVKSNSKFDPIITNSTTGWNEINLACNYSGSAYNGGGVIKTDEVPKTAIATKTTAGTNVITCTSVRDFILNNPITFQGSTFGGILEDTTYYVKTISSRTNGITVSTSFNQFTGTAGPTLTLSNGTGLMYAIIYIGDSTPWTDPLCYVNGNKLTFGTILTVTRTNETRNTVTCQTTSSLAVGQKVTFSNTIFGGVIEPQTIYNILSIYDANEFVLEDPIETGQPLLLTTATGGAEMITNDYTFAIGENGITAKIVFAVGTYDPLVDYITYTAFGETDPMQYGYTIPETQYILVGDGITVYDLTNYIDSINAANAIVDKNGLRLSASYYTIDANLNTISLTNVSDGDIIGVTTFNLPDRQYLNTMDPDTSTFNTSLNYNILPISSVNNKITPYLGIVTVVSCSSIGNLITCDPLGQGTSRLVIGQTIQFKGTAFGNIKTDGTMYYIKTTDSAYTFTISETYLGSTFAVGTGSGTMLSYVGGTPAVRITVTNIGSTFNTNDLVRIDGIEGSTQLNNNTYYLHIIGSDLADLYFEPYNPALNATNYPVLTVSRYTSGGYVWIDTVFTLITTATKETTGDFVLGNRIVTEALGYNGTLNLELNTPVIFTKFGVPLGDPLIGGLIAGTTYYVKRIYNSTEFSVSSTQYGDEFVLTNDTSVDQINITQWEQVNVERLWVTIDGYRVPSSRLRLNPANNLSILAPAASNSTIIITSMIPTSTPQQETYLLSVNTVNYGEVYRANQWDTTWLKQPILDTSEEIFLNDVYKIVDFSVQTVTAPAPVNGIYNIGLNADKNMLTNVTVYSENKVLKTFKLVPADSYEVVVENLSPILKIKAGSYIALGDTLIIEIAEGNVLYVNGEQIKFTEIDFAYQSVLGLTRGANGTGMQSYIPKYATVYGLLGSNRLADNLYNRNWNSYTYNSTLGDPLQISTTQAANFLNGDTN